LALQDKLDFHFNCNAVILRAKWRIECRNLQNYWKRVLGLGCQAVERTADRQLWGAFQATANVSLWPISAGGAKLI